MKPKLTVPEIDIDVICEDPRWEILDLVSLTRSAVTQAMAKLHLALDHIELTVLGADDTRVAALNEAFRGKAKPTNVLSWPAQELSAGDMPLADPDGTVPLGDIALGYETCSKEAQVASLQLADHVSHLLVHGFLHLLGYDHEIDAEAEVMEALEVEILGEMGLNNPYI